MAESFTCVVNGADGGLGLHLVNRGKGREPANRVASSVTKRAAEQSKAEQCGSSDSDRCSAGRELPDAEAVLLETSRGVASLSEFARSADNDRVWCEKRSEWRAERSRMVATRWSSRAGVTAAVL